MSAFKKYLDHDVLTAAKRRIQFCFDNFERISVSFSGGKDSTAMLHLAAEEARKRKRKFALLLIDLEAQYHLTIEHSIKCFEMYRDVIEPYWVSLPIALRNAVSQFEPSWTCWDAQQKNSWVRTPPDFAITNPAHFPFFHDRMEFEEFVELFGPWYGQGKSCAVLVGIRADESLNRFRTLARNKSKFEDIRWTTWIAEGTYNAYPIYDWKTSDIWIYAAKINPVQNPIYEMMTKAGVPLGLQRICQPYGDDQRRGLWLYHLLEPENWGKILSRVSGANSGALYSQDTGNITGVGKIKLPEGHTWESYCKLLLASMPPKTKNHYENKIAVFLKWWSDRGFPDGIPDSSDPKLEASRKIPSWRRICKSLLRNDYWCKGLSFSQHKSGRYDAYLRVMRKRREKWKII